MRPKHRSTNAVSAAWEPTSEQAAFLIEAWRASPAFGWRLGERVGYVLRQFASRFPGAAAPTRVYGWVLRELAPWGHFR